MKQNILFYTFGFFGLTASFIWAQTDSQPPGEDATIHFHVEHHAAQATPIATPAPSASVSPANAGSSAGVPVPRKSDADSAGSPKMIESHDGDQVPPGSDSSQALSNGKPEPYMKDPAFTGKQDLPALAKATQFQADVVSQAGGMSVDAHIYVDGNNVRSDMSMMGMQTSLVVNSHDKQFFQLIPQTNSLVKLPWSADMEQLISPTSISEGKWTRVAKPEVVEGISCDVWNVIENNGTSLKVYINSATGAPVKFTALDDSFSVLWKNYKAGPIDSSLFKKPNGYNEIEAPDSMKNLSPSQLGIHLW